MLKTTPFHSRTSALQQGQAWRRWAGYVVASSYELSHDREYAAIRSAAALLDITPLYKYLIQGRDAVKLLDRVMPRNIAGSKINQVMYSPWCDESGKVLDDGTIARLDEDGFRMTSAEPNLLWLEQNAVGMEVRIEDVSDRIAALALQGPTSRDILKRVTTDADLDALKYFRLTPARLGGLPVTISRTGYTGDLGYEIWLDHRDAENIWDLLIDEGTPYGIVPTGILALDVARIEAGLLLLEVDYVSARRAVIEQQKSTPFELGLGWTVDLKKGPFNGRRAMIAEQQRGPAWRFVGLEVDWDSLERLYAELHLPPRLPTVAWRTSVPVYVDGKQVGYASSGCWSPLLKKYIALAHLESPHARPGTPVNMEVTVEHRRKQAAARVTQIPFFNPERKRA
jgi:aminomethyltransferase